MREGIRGEIEERRAEEEMGAGGRATCMGTFKGEVFEKSNHLFALFSLPPPSLELSANRHHPNLTAVFVTQIVESHSKTKKT